MLYRQPSALRPATAAQRRAWFPLVKLSTRWTVERICEFRASMAFVARPGTAGRAGRPVYVLNLGTRSYPDNGPPHVSVGRRNPATPQMAMAISASPAASASTMSSRSVVSAVSFSRMMTRSSRSGSSAAPVSLASHAWRASPT